MSKEYLSYSNLSVCVSTNSNGSVTSYVGWDNSIHGIAHLINSNFVIDINKNRELETPFHFIFNDKITKPDYVSGKDLFDALFYSINSKKSVDSIYAKWMFDRFKQPSLNLIQYTYFLDDFVTPTFDQKIESAKNTFTGKLALEKGFNSVEIVKEDGFPFITYVGVMFRK